MVQDCPDGGTNWRGSCAQCKSSTGRSIVSFLLLFLSMLTSQILQCAGGDRAKASASDWEPQAVQIGSMRVGILLML